MGKSEWRRIKLHIPDSLLDMYRAMKQYLVRYRDGRMFRKHLRSTDLFLVEHPKSGCTWLTYMLAIVLKRDFECKVTLANLYEFAPYFHGHDSRIAEFSDLPQPRIFRNENPVYPDLYPKSIYVVRDPRAVLVSYFHHYRTVTGDAKMSIRAFIQEYIKHGCIKNFEPGVIKWDKQVMEWVSRANQQDVMIVKYEDMIDDRRTVLVNVLKFIDVMCDEQVISLAVNRGSFMEMKKDEEQHGAESYPGKLGKRGRFIRRGQKDSWKMELNVAEAFQIQSEFAETMKAVGYID